MMSLLQRFKTQHTGQNEMFWSVLTFLGSYGFRENADRMVESIHKNGIYYLLILTNFTLFAKKIKGFHFHLIKNK